MSTSKGLLVSISGPSGVGKNTVISGVRQVFTEFRHSVSVTSRKPRPIDDKGTMEQDGVHYFFRTREEFLKMVEDGEILEYDEFAGNLYGTPAAPIANMRNEGFDVLLDLTIAGSLALEDKFGEEAITIFLAPPSLEVLRQRLEGRGSETAEVIERRLAQAEAEIAESDKFDYVVINDDLSKAVETVCDIIRQEIAKQKK